MGPDELLPATPLAVSARCHGIRLDGGPAAPTVALGTAFDEGVAIKNSGRHGHASSDIASRRSRSARKRPLEDTLPVEPRIIGRRRFGVPHGAAAALAPCEGEGVAAMIARPTLPKENKATKHDATSPRRAPGTRHR